ncbi:MAG: hypothetical protein WDO70_11965 [Alphaproteobacteria bacterium]
MVEAHNGDGLTDAEIVQTYREKYADRGWPTEAQVIDRSIDEAVASFVDVDQARKKASDALKIVVQAAKPEIAELLQAGLSLRWHMDAEMPRKPESEYTKEEKRKYLGKDSKFAALENRNHIAWRALHEAMREQAASLPDLGGCKEDSSYPVRNALPGMFVSRLDHHARSPYVPALPAPDEGPSTPRTPGPTGGSANPALTLG